MTLRLRYFFDPGSGVCLWAGNDAARERFGYPVEAQALPVSENLRRMAWHLCAWHDTSLDWEDPAGPSPWSAEENARFDEAATRFVGELRRALGAGFEVGDERSPRE